MPKKIVNADAKSVTFECGDAGSITLNLDNYPPHVQTLLALHGISQKGGDSYAGAKAAIEGLEISADEYALQQVTAVDAQLAAGDWTTRVAGGPRVTDLVKAFAEVTGHDEEEVAVAAADWDKDQKAAIRKNPEIAAVLSRLRAERSAAKAAKDAKAAANSDSSDLAAFM